MKLGRLALATFLIAQLCDGVFTYAGIHAKGVGIEANTILAGLIGWLGPVPALFAAKTVASACGLFLYTRGLHGALALLTAIYALAAIGPWLLFLRTF